MVNISTILVENKIQSDNNVSISNLGFISVRILLRKRVHKGIYRVCVSSPASSLLQLSPNKVCVQSHNQCESQPLKEYLLESGKCLRNYLAILCFPQQDSDQHLLYYKQILALKCIFCPKVTHMPHPKYHENHVKCIRSKPNFHFLIYAPIHLNLIGLWFCSFLSRAACDKKKWLLIGQTETFPPYLNQSVIRS